MTAQKEPATMMSIKARRGVRMDRDDNGEQKRSKSFLLPVEDTEFLLRDEMRSIRFALEYAKAELLLREWGVRSTVVVFGSARILSPDVAPNAQHAIWYERARGFARLVSERGGALSPHNGLRDNVIATGGGPGIMEAANRGARDAGAPSIGFNITLPHEQEPNAYSTPDLTFRFHYFAMRKMHLAMRASALAVFPGGFGTMDELFELLTLQQTHKAPKMPIVLFGRDYWSKVINFDAMVDAGMLAAEDLRLLEIVDEVEEGWRSIVRRGLEVATQPPDTP
jgi:uncharacterized protein (TIGR00730 family)